MQSNSELRSPVDAQGHDTIGRLDPPASQTANAPGLAHSSESPPTAANRPILVTGTIRSGTTWIGRIISCSPRVFYAFEPFAPQDWNRLIIRKHPLPDFLPFLTDTTITPSIRRFVTDSLGFTCSLGQELRSIRSPRDVFKVILRLERFCSIKALSLRVLLKDPHALLSAPWLAKEFSMQTILTLRHPAAFVNSMVKWRWRYPINDLSKFTPLVEGPWADYAEKIYSYSPETTSDIDAAILLWNCSNKILLDYMSQHPDWLFIKHEALAGDPTAGFERIFNFLGIPFDDRLRARVAEYSSPKNPDASIDPHDVRRNSSATVGQWKRELSREAIRSIRDQTSPISDSLYGSDDW